MTALGTGFTRSRCWFRAHPPALDAALALAVLVTMVIGSFADPHGGPNGPTFGTRTPGVLSLVLMLLSSGALVFRRRRPLAVLAFTGVVTLAELVSGDPPAPVAMSAVIALYTVASRTDRPTTWRVGLLTMTGLTAAAMCFGDGPWYSQENLGIFAWTGIGASAGDAVRSRRAFVDAIRERAERAERTREEEARRRVAEERLRIARDLHDVVAHHIALVNVQAGVAAHVMDKRPDQAKEALAHVREASRSALNELRATVGLLRQSGDPEAPTEPAPGLGVLDQLLDTFRNAGLPVEVARPDRGVAAPLPAAVDLAAYRIIQEALTNVQKHAGAHAKAEVSVVCVGSSVEITVIDNGGGTRSADDRPRDGGGHGLTGMRERVTALGGTLTAGPRYGGGFRVHAILPFQVRTGEKTVENA
ncbi:two-component sensor histidine kinase [Streptomyces agglomeratus]|uniref:histidine kinase n=1 Tax=Streptomyces agglomeratus TaxID=285458 RepID=A0A1E5PCF4_9ACTN|nr:sensor histidine kinase [Streptomyces agglomeratus]OEJ27218.1 two-component sensor histidine kinase [Streptomyces agglomeratus]OEJ38727.1 two-component sensor histidine kinase [Streptomyces agglomeratus]OEJ46887.1 two-component sensor histidine kinase [Streptomyces agglomeratus]OEJ51253.1 two-component sensor histidine kinase [Streptomyces agglomeratus]OEJ58623.1 two-component sensor histidine kinase [Streptomyces agglomeratus]